MRRRPVPAIVAAAAADGAHNAANAAARGPEDMTMGDSQAFLVRNRWTFLIGILLTGALLVVVIDPLTGSNRISTDNPFWFVGLLVIFAAALTLMAVVFRWLGMDNGQEAFALPSGSVRTLLAVGVMVLFAFFGLTFFSKATEQGPKQRIAGTPLRVVEAPAEAQALAAEIRRYEAYGFVVVKVAAGSASAPLAPARLELFQKEASLPQDVSDMQKQVLTAVATLLTTVIGFYFGSRSAEGARSPEPARPDGDGDAALRSDLETQLARWTALKDDAVPEEAAAAFAALRSQLDEAAQRLEAARTGPPEALREALEAFKRDLAEAERLLAVG